jgi:hypothetical protein
MSTSNIKKISEGFEDAVEKLKLEKENQALQLTVDKLLKEIDTLRSTIVPKPQLIKIHVTPEEEILDQQIRLLQAKSRVGMLEMNEAKMLDLYIKNKRLLQDKSTLNADFNSLPVNDSMTNEQLLQLIESEKTDVQKIESPVGSGEDSLG